MPSQTIARSSSELEAPAPDTAHRPSKTALKRQAHDLQQLGQALSEMPDDRLASLPMPEVLLDALRELKRTRSHEGRRRQLQFVGKQMRRVDVQPLEEAVAGMKIGSAQDALALHRAERWREALVSDAGALERWMVAYPRCDGQRLRALVRNAQRDAALPPDRRHGRAWRELFQYIKPHMQGTPVDPVHASQE